MSKKVKQMSYLSMIIFIIGSTIGAGIFIKNRTLAHLAHGQLGPILATWGVAIIGVLALALSLIEVSSAQKSDRGTLEWTKLFTPKWFHKSSTNFVKYIFVPLTLFAMPLYVISTLQSTGWEIKHGIIALAISFAIFMWFMIINLISFRFSEISQWVFTIIQTVPLVLLPIVAYLNPLDGSEITQKHIESSKGINGVGPWIAMIAGVSSIVFAFDGFYTITSMKEETSGKAKMGTGLMLGVSIVAMIYLFLTIAFNVGSSDGTHQGILFVEKHPTFTKIMDVFIAIGIVSVINGYTMSFPRQMRSLAEEGESNEVIWLQRLIYRKPSKVSFKRQLEVSGWIYALIITSLLYLTLGLIGVYVYELNNYSHLGKVGALYTLSDALVNFNSLLMFIIIATTVLGALINRKTKKIATKKTRGFIVAACICVSIFYLAGVYMIGAALLDMFNLVGDLDKDEITSAIIKFSVFIGILGISIIPSLFPNALSKIKEARIKT